MFVYDDSVYTLPALRDLWRDDKSTDGASCITFREYVARILSECVDGGNDVKPVLLTREECARLARRLRASENDGGDSPRRPADNRESSRDLFPCATFFRSKNRYVYYVVYCTEIGGELKGISVCACSRKHAYNTAVNDILRAEGTPPVMARVASVTFANGNYRAFNTSFSHPY